MNGRKVFFTDGPGFKGSNILKVLLKKRVCSTIFELEILKFLAENSININNPEKNNYGRYCFN